MRAFSFVFFFCLFFFECKIKNDEDNAVSRGILFRITGFIPPLPLSRPIFRFFLFFFTHDLTLCLERKSLGLSWSFFLFGSFSVPAMVVLCKEFNFYYLNITNIPYDPEGIKCVVILLSCETRLPISPNCIPFRNLLHKTFVVIVSQLINICAFALLCNDLLSFIYAIYAYIKW